MKILKTLLLIILIIFCSFSISSAQKNTFSLERVEPAFWWVGMKNPNLQLIVHGKDISKSEVSLSYSGIKLKTITKVSNPNYLFLDLEISKDAKAGSFPIEFKIGKKSQTYTYQLKARTFSKNKHQGFSSADAIYLVMPDRFANGNPDNDNVAGMLETLDRKDHFGRHGGDLKGVANHLDYIADLGFTTLWLNPALENDMPKQSYHGYAITDFYKVDPRMGSNEEYAQLVETCHQKGLKVIMDMVVNHCGTNYYFIKDLPTEDWVHQFPEFTRSSYRGVTQIDPYRAESDFNIMLKGWFDTTMADLNQENPLVATYLIQNTIWWIEYSGIDGIRMDTYSYPYKAFLANWAKAVFDEYPQFNIVGEVWEYLATTQAHWLKGYGDNPDGYESHLPSVTDFVLAQALGEAFKEEEGWDRGVSRLYYTLTQDRIYPNANGLVTFLDNHDVARYFTVVGEDPRKLKMGIATLLTTRGIPQIYYGTELLMTGNGHDEVREEFPGGWADHPKSAFTKEGRTDTQNEMFDYMQALLQWRKNTPVVYQGKLMHYVPENGVYVYFRYDANHCVMVVLNNSPDKTQTISTQRYQQRMQGYTKATDILNGIMINDLSQLTIPAKSALVLELKK